MKTTCLINNFNYGAYVVEAVNSVLNQSVSFDEIIVVDDGSEDDSAKVLLDNFSGFSKVKLILEQSNEGQLSSINKGFQISTGEIIFFLDSDDLYEYDYLQKSLNFYNEHPECTFLFCAYTDFGDAISGDSLVQMYKNKQNFGYSVLRTFYSKQWIGSITSTLSIKRSVLNKVLPIPFVDDWRTRADDCLVWGASLVGAIKFYIPEFLIRRRIHSSNDSAKHPSLQANNCYLYQRYLNINRLFEFLWQRMTYTSRLFEIANLEFRTIPFPSHTDLKLYINMVFEANLPLFTKIRIVGSIAKHFWLQKYYGSCLKDGR